MGWRSGRLLSFQKTENETGFPSIVLKPASIAVGSDESFLFGTYTRKNMLFAQSTSPLPRFSPHRTRTGHHQTWRAYAPISLESSLPKFEGRRWSMSRGLAWDVGASPISGRTTLIYWQSWQHPQPVHCQYYGQYCQYYGQYCQYYDQYYCYTGVNITPAPRT